MLLNIPFGALQVIAIFTAFVSPHAIYVAQILTIYGIQWAARSFRLKSAVLLAALVPCIVGAGLLRG